MFLLSLLPAILDLSGQRRTFRRKRGNWTSSQAPGVSEISSDFWKLRAIASKRHGADFRAGTWRGGHMGGLAVRGLWPSVGLGRGAGLEPTGGPTCPVEHNFPEHQCHTWVILWPSDKPPHLLSLNVDGPWTSSKLQKWPNLSDGGDAPGRTWPHLATASWPGIAGAWPYSPHRLHRDAHSWNSVRLWEQPIQIKPRPLEPSPRSPDTLK